MLKPETRSRGGVWDGGGTKGKFNVAYRVFGLTAAYRLFSRGCPKKFKYSMIMLLPSACCLQVPCAYRPNVKFISFA